MRLVWDTYGCTVKYWWTAITNGKITIHYELHLRERSTNTVVVTSPNKVWEGAFEIVPSPSWHDQIRQIILVELSSRKNYPYFWIHSFHMVDPSNLFIELRAITPRLVFV